MGGRRAVGPGVGLGHRQRRARCRRELEPPALPPPAAHRAMTSVLPEARLSAPPPREWGRSAVGAVSGASPQAAGAGALGGRELRGERGGRAVPARGGTDQATLLCGLVPRTHGWIPLLGDALPFHTRPTRPAATAGGAGATRGRNAERLLPFPRRAAGEPPAGPRRGLLGSHRGQQGRRQGWGGPPFVPANLCPLKLVSLAFRPESPWARVVGPVRTGPCRPRGPHRVPAAATRWPGARAPDIFDM